MTENHPLNAENDILAEEPYNAADPVQVNEARKKEGRQTRRKLDYTKTIMSSKEGRAWMLELLNACKTFTSPIVAGDAYFTYHNIGEQNIGKKLLQDINKAAPDQYILMMKEAR